MPRMKVSYFTYLEFKCSARDPLRSEFAHGAASVKNWKSKWGHQQAWRSWPAATPRASLYNRHARPKAPCNAAPLGWAVAA